MKVFLSPVLILALYHPFCTPAVQPTAAPAAVRMAELWQEPDPRHADLFYGPWGPERVPNPDATYTFVARKEHGTNPGLTVTDPTGREWQVKQPPHNAQGAEGPVEVTLSRVLSAIGYHQPPVYFVPRLSVADADGVHIEPGGRFRLKDKSLRSAGEWSWQQNPFVGTRPYGALLVVLLMFNSSDLKNENNQLYDVRGHGQHETRWFVVRDLGTALGETGRFAPRRGDPDIFAREPFITGVSGDRVQFSYHGWHQELVRDISTQDVAFAAHLLEQLSDRQWHDAFRAGGFPQPSADRFITRVKEKIAEARQRSRGAAEDQKASSSRGSH